MSIFLQSLANTFKGSSWQRHLLDAVLHNGLPSTRNEAWKYTSLRMLERRSFVPSAEQNPISIDSSKLEHIPSPRLVFINGMPALDLSDVSVITKGMQVRTLSSVQQHAPETLRFLKRRFNQNEEVFAQLNAALVDDGVLIQLDEAVQMDDVLHLVFINTPIPTENKLDCFWNHRHLIELRQHAALTLVEHHLHLGESAHFSNTLTHIHLSKGAKLTHARVQNDSSHATSLLRSDTVLAPNARYQRLDLELGAALSRHELNVRLEGRHAQLNANGILLGNARRHLDTRLNIDHIAGHTQAQLLWRGMATAFSRAVFHGGIHIRAGADGSQADLSNKNLLLSENAEIDTQPTLTIEADEVKATHGATVGQLDAQALFYLRSRGIEQTQAKAMLAQAFCHAPLAILDDTLLHTLTPYLNQALQQTGI